MLTLVPAVALTALIYAAIQFLKAVTNGDFKTAGGQVIVWLAGIGGAFLGANSDFLRHYVIAGTQLGLLDGWSLVLLGTALGSAATAANVFTKAIDNTQSAAPAGSIIPTKAAEPVADVPGA